MKMTVLLIMMLMMLVMHLVHFNSKTDEEEDLVCSYLGGGGLRH